MLPVAPAPDGALRAAVQEVVHQSLGRTVDVVAVRQLSGGASRETWVVDVPAMSGGRLILRRDPPGMSRDDGVDLEVASIRAAERAGVPVPEIVAADGSGGPIGTPYMLMTFVDGETVPRRILRQPELAVARTVLAGQCGEVLARWHAVDPGAVAGLADLDGLAFQAERLAALPEPHPVLELGLAWLRARRPDAAASRPVHGDFRNGNFIVGPEGLRAVLDWEVVHRGDPYEDLGWLCVRAWRFRSDHPVGGFGSFEDLIAGYEQVSGAPVDRDRFRWWLVFGTVRWGVTCNFQADKHLSGRVRSIDLAAIGRRACETELDLLDLIDHVEASS